MYIPAHFRVDHPETIASFIQCYSFATLITNDGQAPFASHLPVLLEEKSGPNGTLLSHMARANPQWQHFQNGQEVLVIFQGPHAYVSPAWYESTLVVPTWNYAVVHAYGVPRLIHDHQTLVALLDRTVATFEAHTEKPWKGTLPDDFRDKLAQAIVGFEIPISRLEGKFKLGQNRSESDRNGVYRALSASKNPGDRALAELMRTHSVASQV